MIIFCEDCGKRNRIQDAQIVKQRAVFQCTACQYQNNFALRANQIPWISRFSKRLKTHISQNRNATGAFVYSRKNCIINLMPESIKPQDIDLLARHLAAAFAQAAGELESLCEMSVAIGNRTISFAKNSHHMLLILVSRENMDAPSAFEPELLTAFNALKI